MILPSFTKQTLLLILLNSLTTTTTHAQTSLYQWTELDHLSGSPPISEAGSTQPAVALAGDGDIIFGYPDFSNEFDQNGITNVYTGSKSYTFVHNLKPLGNTANNFGSAVAVYYNTGDAPDDSIALVGASQANSESGMLGAGEVWLYRRSELSTRQFI